MNLSTALVNRTLYFCSLEAFSISSIRYIRAKPFSYLHRPCDTEVFRKGSTYNNLQEGPIIMKKIFTVFAINLLLLSTMLTSNAIAFDKLSIDDPDRFNHKFAEVNGIRMHFVDEGVGPLVILLHGFPLSWYSWRAQIPALVDAGYRVVVPDQRGYGQTEQPKNVDAYDITQLVGDVVGLIDEVEEETAVLVGWDWGSPVAWTTALLRPDLIRGLVMVSSPYQPRSPVTPSKAWPLAFKEGIFYQQYFQEVGVVESELKTDPRKYMLGLLYSISGSAPPDEQWRFVMKDGEKMIDVITIPERLPNWLSPKAFDFYAEEYTRYGFVGALNWYRAMDRTWEITSFLSGAKIQQPALFVAGDQDPGIIYGKRAFDDLENQVPNLRKKVLLKGVGHLAPEEQPEKFNELVIEFLKGLDRPEQKSEKESVQVSSQKVRVNRSTHGLD